jgi:omega-6 fatty acid desaturase (delta-12 desaturase)
MNICSTAHQESRFPNNNILGIVQIWNRPIINSPESTNESQHNDSMVREKPQVDEILKPKGVSVADIEKHISNYGSDTTRGFIYLFNTLLIIAAIYGSYFIIPYKAFWPVWVVLRTMLFIRIYILFHDCTHGSYFENQTWNWVLGVICSGPCATPFQYWRLGHLYHHGHVGDRGAPDGSRTILFTTEEYEPMPWATKLMWRIVRDPIFFFTFVPSYQFLVSYRWSRWFEWHSHVPSVYLIVHYYVLYRLDPTLALLDFIGLCAGTTYGFLLFHWQHEVNSAYWVDTEKYNLKDASLLGCTYLLVPELAKWSTLGIEYHHIHHLSTKVPCYNLRACHEEAPPAFWSMVTIVDGKKAFAGAFNSMWNVKTQRFEMFDYYNDLVKYMGLEGHN